MAKGFVASRALAVWQQPSIDRLDGWPVRERWIRPLVLRALGLAAEGVAVAALGYVAIAAAGIEQTQLPGPILVGMGYIVLLLVQDGVVAPPHDAKTAIAIRTLASAFLCVGIVIAHPML